MNGREKEKVIPLFEKGKAEKFMEEVLERYKRNEITELICCVRFTEDKGASYSTMTSWWGLSVFSLYLLGMASRMAGIIERYIERSYPTDDIR